MRPALRLLSASLVLLVVPFSAPANDPVLADLEKKLEAGATEPFEQRGREQAIRALGKLGGKAAAEALLVVFDDPFEHLRDHAVSAWVTMLEGSQAEETCEWLVQKALRHGEAGVRRGAAIALGLTRQKRAEDVMLGRLAKERDVGAIQGLLRAWPAVGGGAAPAVQKLLAHRSGAVALAAAESIVGANSASSVPEAEGLRLLRHRDPLGRAGGVLLAAAAGRLRPPQVDAVLADEAAEPKIALTEALGREPSSRTGVDRTQLLGRLLGDAFWRVRAAALATVVDDWRKDAIPFLVERLDLEDGRLKLEIVQALAAMTGKELGFDADLWRAWWRAKGADFEMPRRPRKDRRQEKRAPAGAESKTAAFFRLPVVSKRIAFLLDCSGSMGKPALGEKVGGITKMEIARKELKKTLEDLDAETVFDVFLYRYPSDYPPKPRMTRAFKKLRPCSPRRAKEAIAWLSEERQEPKGWGAFYDALKILIDTEDVDTIFFLSDGRPSRGRYDRDFRLIQELVRDNRFRRVAIHTVLVGESGADRDFMQQLAATTRGRFVDAVPHLEQALGR